MTEARRPLWFLCPRCRWSISTRGLAVVFLLRLWAHRLRWRHPRAVLVLPGLDPGLEQVIGDVRAYVQFSDGSVLP